MNDILFPTADVPELMEEPEYEDVYRPSVAWDDALGDFVRSSSHKMVACDGVDAYKTWCVKMAATERYTRLAYPDELGVEIESAVKEDGDGAVESALERTITEALLVNPRTEYVRGFTFDRSGDTLQCSFIVKGNGIEEFPVSVNIGSEVSSNGL